jgi:hypothetical protein
MGLMAKWQTILFLWFGTLCSSVISFHIHSNFPVGIAALNVKVISGQQQYSCGKSTLRKSIRGIRLSMSANQNKLENQGIQDPARQAIEYNFGMKDIADKYDAYLLDQWGVLHDGTKAYEGAVDCLNKLLSKGKLIVLLSNSSKRLGNSMKKLDAMGIER